MPAHWIMIHLISGVISLPPSTSIDLLVPRYLLLSIIFLGLQALLLLIMGRVSYCTCGYIKLWEGDVASSGNSQHLSDWYSFSHFIHGFSFYFLLWLIARRWPVGVRFAIAVFVEASWEVFENTDFVIER